MIVLVRLKETVKDTDWCKSGVMARIKNNMQCFLLDQSGKDLCQTGADLRHQIRRLPTYP